MSKEARRRLQTAVNTLALKKVKTCRRWIRHCSFCDQPIHPGQFYRGASSGLCSHEACFQAVSGGLSP